MNYNVFDPFLSRDTWHTFHPLDERMFFQCLHKVVRDPDFSPERWVNTSAKLERLATIRHSLKTL
jgi:hypothetical protein